MTIQLSIPIINKIVLNELEFLDNTFKSSLTMNYRT